MSHGDSNLEAEEAREQEPQNPSDTIHTPDASYRIDFEPPKENIDVESVQIFLEEPKPEEKEFRLSEDSQADNLKVRVGPEVEEKDTNVGDEKAVLETEGTQNDVEKQQEDTTIIEKHETEEMKKEEDETATKGTKEEDFSIDAFNLLGVDEQKSESTFSFHDEEEEGEGQKKKKKKDELESTDVQGKDGDFMLLESSIASQEMRSMISQKPSELAEEKPGTILEEEHEAEEEEEEQEEMSEAVRNQYYETYDKLDKQYQDEKIKNNFLLKKLVLYYQKKKMFHVLQESKVSTEGLKKYEKLLDDFQALSESSKSEQITMQNEINELREKCIQAENEAQRCFEKLQKDEFEVGKEITSAESGQGYEEKIIDRFLKRQKIQLNNLKKIRLDYIKIRNKVTDTQEALDAIDNLGPDLHLIDYEQLKHDNRNLQDKLEEKELELTHSRLKCQNAVQILAHRREKTNALDTDIANLNERLEGVSGEYEDVREQLNALKQERDYYRSATDKMKIESGLLNQPKLLQDMSLTLEDNKVMYEAVENVRQEYFTLFNKVKNLRKNMGSASKLRAIKKKMKKRDSEDSDGFEPEVSLPRILVSTEPRQQSETRYNKRLGTVKVVKLSKSSRSSLGLST